MRKTKNGILRTKYRLNNVDEIIAHIIETSDIEINLDECEINCDFDLRGLLKILKDEIGFDDKVEIRYDINEFGYNVFYCILKIPFRCETTIFKKGAFIELVDFEDYAQFTGAVFESDYSFKKSVFHFSVSFSTVDFETSLFSRPDSSFYRTIFKKDVSFFMAHFHSVAYFRSAIFCEGFNIDYAEFSNIDLSNVEFKENSKLLNYHTATILNVNNRETGLYLKQYALNMHDSFSMLHFKKLEMEAYRKHLINRPPEMEIPNTKKLLNKISTHSDLVILWLGKWSNSYGSNYLRGILFTIFVWFAFFSWFIMMRDGLGGEFIWTNSECLYEAVNYFWLFNGLDGLSIESSTTWQCIIPFFLGKIFIAFGIYQTIIAFRKFSK